MQIGMIGLGPMGASMTARLMSGGHDCVEANSGERGERLMNADSRVVFLLDVDNTLLDNDHIEGMLPADGGDSAAVIAACRRAGIDDAKLAERLQQEGVQAFSRSWRQLLQRIAAKRRGLAQAGAR